MAEAIPTYFEEVEVLAKADRSSPTNPFGRVPNTIRVTYADLQQREGELLAVLEIYDEKLERHTELFTGQSEESDAVANDAYLGRLPISYLRTYTGKLAGLYALSEPSRKYYYQGKRVDKDHAKYAVVERLEEAYREENANEVLRMADTYAVLCGNAAIHCYYDRDTENVIFNLHPSPYVRVVNNQSNPANPKGVVLWGVDYERQADNVARAESISVANAWRYFDGAVDFAQFRGGNMQSDWQRLPLDRIPVTHVFDAKPEPRTGYYIPARGHLLCAQTMMINSDYLATLGQACIMQGFSIMVVVGLDGSKKLKIGPGRAVRFDDPNPDIPQGVSFEQPNAPLTEMFDIITGLISEIERSHGIPSSSISVETDSSGAAIVQANGPLAEIRNMRKPLFRNVETSLMRNTLAVLSAFENGFTAEDPNEWDVHVEYEQAKASQSTQDQIAMDMHLLNLGVTTEAEIAMREKPQMFDSPEEAQAWVDANFEQAEPDAEQEETTEEETEDGIEDDPLDLGDEEEEGDE
jgi:hypothetical protein